MAVTNRISFVAEKVHQTVLEQFHLLFVQHRLRLGLSLEKVAEELGVHPQTTKSWNKGLAMADTDNMVALFNLFGTEFVNDFIGLAGYGGAFKTEGDAVTPSELLAVIAGASALLSKFLIDGKVCHKEFPELTKVLSRVQSDISNFVKRKGMH